MIVQLTTTSKRENSTAIPSMSYSTQCRLKAPSSVMTPVLMFDRENLDHEYNYIYIPDFNRYYWVTDVVYSGALIEYRCRIDVLASYKTAIGNSTQYILRSASRFNGDIVDSTYPLTTTVERGFTGLTNHWYEWGSGRGWWVVGVSGNGGISYYALNRSAFGAFITYILSDVYVDAVLQSYLLDELFPQLKMAVDPLQYLNSVVWIPFQVSASTTTTINVGPVAVPISVGTAYALGSSGMLQMIREYITMRDHPMAQTRGEYLNTAAFTSCSLCYAPFGIFDLDVAMCKQADEIALSVAVDLASGGAILELSLYNDIGDGVYAAVDTPVRASASVGVNIPVSQVITKGWSPVSAITSMVGAIAGSTDKLSLAGNLLGGIANGVSDYAEGKIPKIRTSGSKGDLSDLYGLHEITYEWHIPVDDDNTQHGRPLCELVQINTLSGYILCATGTEIHITGTAAEEEQIRAYLEGGFYYE